MSRAKTTSSTQIQLPKLRRQPRPGGHDRAFFVLHGRRHYVGRWGTPEAEQRYRRPNVESLTTGQALLTRCGADPDITIVEVVDGYWQHLVRRYGKVRAKKRSVCSGMKLLLNLPDSPISSGMAGLSGGAWQSCGSPWADAAVAEVPLALKTASVARGWAAFQHRLQRQDPLKGRLRDRPGASALAVGPGTTRRWPIVRRAVAPDR